MKKKVLEILSKGGVKGLAHITGDGFTDNQPVRLVVSDHGL